MNRFEIVLLFAGAALFAVWLANALVGILSGERPGDAGRLWLDAFLRIFAVMEFGFIGRVLNFMGLEGWPRRAVLLLGLFGLMYFLAGACHHKELGHSYPSPAQSP